MRKRWFVVVAASAAVSGVTGYALGSARDAEDAPARVVASDDDAAASSSPETTVTADAAGGWSAVASAERVATGAAYAPVATPVVARTAADGTIVRAIEVRWPEEMRELTGPGWVPPLECRNVGNLEIGFAGPQDVAMGWAAVFGSAPETYEVWGSGTAGYASLGGYLYGVVRVTAGVAAVRLVVDGAVLDEVAPEDGWAIVAGRVAPTTGEVDMTSAALDIVGAGGSVETRPVGRMDDRSTRAACQPPPPPLPDGMGPLGDGDAEAVRSAYRAVFEPPPDDLRANIAGGDVLPEDIAEQARQASEDYGVGAITVDFGAVGSIDPTTALVAFRLDGAPLSWTFGEALLVDGTWKVSARTWCSLVNMVGVTCPEALSTPGEGTSRFQPYTEGGG